MPRQGRVKVDGAAYHVLTRGNRKQTIFHKPGDYRAFLGILEEAQTLFDMPLCGVCVNSTGIRSGISDRPVRSR